MLLDERRLQHAPAVSRADEPEGQHAAGEDHDPAVAAIWGLGVGEERSADYSVGVGGVEGGGRCGGVWRVVERGGELDG